MCTLPRKVGYGQGMNYIMSHNDIMWTLLAGTYLWWVQPKSNEKGQLILEQKVAWNNHSGWILAIGSTPCSDRWLTPIFQFSVAFEVMHQFTLNQLCKFQITSSLPFLIFLPHRSPHSRSYLAMVAPGILPRAWKRVKVRKIIIKDD